jgi:hypothetical protein
MKRLNIDYSWQDNAACKGMSSENYDSFYVSTGKSAAKETGGICNECPVQEQCLNYALQYELLGFWGNTSAAQRQRMRQQLGIELIDIDHDSIVDSYNETIIVEEFQ